MSGYMTACDNTLVAYVKMSETLAQDDALQVLGETLVAQYEAMGKSPRCTDLQKCLHERMMCMNRARESRDACITAADQQQEADLAACEQEYDDDIANGINATLAATLLLACNAGANGTHFGAVLDCQGDFAWDAGNCAGEYVECITRAIAPF